MAEAPLPDPHDALRAAQMILLGFRGFEEAKRVLETAQAYSTRLAELDAQVKARMESCQEVDRQLDVTKQRHAQQIEAARKAMQEWDLRLSAVREEVALLEGQRTALQHDVADLEPARRALATVREQLARAEESWREREQATVAHEQDCERRRLQADRAASVAEERVRELRSLLANTLHSEPVT